MKMLRYLGLLVCVVFITAFASGCGGGGGGGSAMDDDGAVMMCTEGQVGTYPDCMDPGPTDADRIASAKNTLAGIVANARTAELAARTAAAAVQFHPDATATDITSALANAVEAQNLLTEIVGVSAAANAATTPEEAEMAVTDAVAKLADLTLAQSGAESIQNAVLAVASQRQQRVTDERALTNNSSLIKHVRANKLVSDTLLTDLVTNGADRLNVGPTGTNNATYAADTGTGADRVIGQRTVVVQGLTSDSKTPLLTGTGRLPHGFDLNIEGGTTFVNAYTDITKTRANVRRRTNVLEDDPGTLGTDMDERYENVDIADTDYLLAGIWLVTNNQIDAFAYGSQPIINAPSNFCVGIEGPTAPVSSTTGTTITTTTTRECDQTTGFDRISLFVKDGQDVSATYRGDANGAYLAGGETSYFRASVELTAEFQNPTSDTPGQQTPTAADGKGSIQGAVTNISVGGQSMAGSIELQKHTFADTITGQFGDDAVGVVGGKSFSGGWEGQFFGLRTTRSQTTDTDDSTPTAIERTITTTYSPQHPGSVAGTFQVIQKSNPANEAAFIGAFGAHR